MRHAATPFSTPVAGKPGGTDGAQCAVTVNALILYLVVGLAVGLVASLAAGRQSMGLVGTCLLGATGAFIGGILGSFNVADDQFMVVRLAGVVHASLGAAITVVLVLGVRELRAPKKKSSWTDGLLASDRRSFEAISKQNQRTP